MNGCLGWGMLGEPVFGDDWQVPVAALTIGIDKKCKAFTLAVEDEPPDLLAPGGQVSLAPMKTARLVKSELWLKTGALQVGGPYRWWWQIGVHIVDFEIRRGGDFYSAWLWRLDRYKDLREDLERGRICGLRYVGAEE